MRSLQDTSLSEAEKVIDSSNLVELTSGAINSFKKVSGRPSQLSVRTFLVALMLLAQTGTMHLVRIPKILNDLPKADRKRLGIDRPGGVTRRQVERLYSLMCNAFQHQGLETFDRFCNELLAATLDPSCSNTSSIAIDATSIDSWGRRRRFVDSNGEVFYSNSDPDARWRRKSKDNPWRRPVFGFDLTIAATIPEIAGPDVALAARAMRFRPALTEPVAMGREVVAEVARQQNRLGDVVADREYTSTHNGHDFIMPVRSLGAEPVFELTASQLGAHGTCAGAVIIDGHPFSPSTPPSLFHLVPPPPTAPVKDLIEYQEKINTRAKYALVPHGSRKPNGAVDMRCPAAAGKLACALVALSKNNPFPAVLAPKSPAKGSVCTKQFTRFHASDIALSQKDLFGTPEWFSSMSRRSRVEGFFGNLKNEACENLKRGTIRVTGLIKTGVLVGFAVACTNLRLARSFALRPRTEPKKRRGRPKKSGVKDFEQIFSKAAQPNAPPPA